MATYLELRSLYDNDTLKQRVEVALLIAAQGLIDGATPTAAQRAWAKYVFSNPSNEAYTVLKYLLAKNNASTTTQITGVTDAALQTLVSAVVPQLISALSGA